MDEPRALDRWFAAAALVAALAGCGGGGAAPAPAPSPSPTPAPAPAPGSGPLLGACEAFPASAIFNTRIDDPARFPAHPNSAAWVAAVGGERRFHADWGTSENAAQPGTYYGIPYNVVAAGGTDWPLVSFDFTPSGASTQRGWPEESDCAVASGGGFTLTRGCDAVLAAQRRFPFPLAAQLKNEGGQCDDPATCGDHHVLVVEQGACRLWEAYAGYRIGGQWYAMSTAAWDLRSLALRPAGWTSGDAAGLPITPLLARAAEASAGEVRHALRVTFQDGVLARGFTWPARHGAGGDTPGGIPFGSVLRLRADFTIPADWTVQARALATAMKRYGLYVADIGSHFYVQGEPSAGWDPRTIAQLQTIPMGQMEFVDLGAVTRDPRWSPDSMAAGW
jgi:hypothetical protein